MVQPPPHTQKNGTLYVNKMQVTESDMMATNGVVHAMDTIVKPLRKGCRPPRRFGRLLVLQDQY